jgi:hypothetical protein
MSSGRQQQQRWTKSREVQRSRSAGGCPGRCCPTHPSGELETHSAAPVRNHRLVVHRVKQSDVMWPY